MISVRHRIPRLRYTYSLYSTSSRCSSATTDFNSLKKSTSGTNRNQLRAYPFLVVMSDSATKKEISTHPVFRKIASAYQQIAQLPTGENFAEQTKLQPKDCEEQDGRTAVSRRSMCRGSPFANSMLDSEVNIETNLIHPLCLDGKVNDRPLVLDVGRLKETSLSFHGLKVHLHTNLGEKRRVLVVEELHRRQNHTHDRE